MNDLFLKIVNMSISATWLVFAVLLLRLPLRRGPKWATVLLWGVVAVRLICPFSFKSPLSLIPSAETIPEDIEMYASPAINTGIAAVNQVVNPMISASFAQDPTASANPLQVWIPVACVIWLVGMALMLLYTAISYWRLRRRVSTAVLYADNIFQSENVDSPFVLGIIRPKIYLPFDTGARALEHIIAHERTHIHRRDHWWKPLGFLLLTVHWFNPVMWFAYALLCRDIELACDEKVIGALDNECRADYTRALVECSVDRRALAACPLAFGETGVKVRVRSVLNYKKPTFWVVTLAVTVCAFVALCFLTDPAGTRLTKWTIDEVNMSAALSDVRSLTVARYDESATFDGSDADRFLATMDKIRVGRSPVSMSRDEARYHDFFVTVNDGLTLYFADDFSELWVDNGLKPSYAYPIVNPDIAAELFDSSPKSAGNVFLLAKLLETDNGYFLVEPVEGSPELNSADRIEISMKNMSPSPEPQIGDILQIEYDGELQESYPARISEPYSVSVVEMTGFYLTVGAEGVKSIELTMPGSSSGCENADGSLYKKGDRILLEPLDGRTSLWGVTITALGEDGEVIWTASVPATEGNRGFTRLVNDDWVVTNH